MAKMLIKLVYADSTLVSSCSTESRDDVYEIDEEPRFLKESGLLYFKDAENGDKVYINKDKLIGFRLHEIKEEFISRKVEFLKPIDSSDPGER